MGQINNRLGNTLLETGCFPPCRVATTGAVTLSGLQTIDGVTLIEGDRVLVKNQTDQTTNGIYGAATGNWVRTTDAQSNTQFFQGMVVFIAKGLISGGFMYQCTSADDPVVIGTSLITWAGTLSNANRTRVSGGLLTLYVDRTNGNDNNTGTTSGTGAFKTIQAACNALSNLWDVAGGQVIIQLAANQTYPENVVLPEYLPVGVQAQQTVIIQGDSATAPTVLIQPPSGGKGVLAVGVTSPWRLKNLRINAPGDTCVVCDTNPWISVDGVFTGPADGTTGKPNIHYQGYNNGQVEWMSNCTLSSGAQNAFAFSNGGRGLCVGVTISVDHNANFTDAFLSVGTNGGFMAVGSTFAGPGVVTGTKFKQVTGGWIDVGGADPNSKFLGDVIGFVNVAQPVGTAIGVLDNTNIGQSVPKAGQFTTLTGSTIAGSSPVPNGILADFTNTSATGPIAVRAKVSGVVGSHVSFLLIGADSAADKVYIYGNGDIQNANNSYGAISDRRNKRDIVGARDYLALLEQLRIVEFTLKDDPTGRRQLGVIAQQVEPILPELVLEVTTRGRRGRRINRKGVEYSRLVPMLVRALQELSARVLALEASAQQRPRSRPRKTQSISGPCR